MPISIRYRFKSITTPEPVVAYFPYLNKPDTEYNAEGVYKVDIEATDELLDFIEKSYDSQWKEFLAELENDPKMKDSEKARMKDLSISGAIVREYTTSSGEERRGLRFKSKYAPAIYNAKAEKEGVTITPGSRIKLNFSISPWATKMGVGISLKLWSVQLLEAGNISGSGNPFADESQGDPDADESTIPAFEAQ